MRQPTATTIAIAIAVTACEVPSDPKAPYREVDARTSLASDVIVEGQVRVSLHARGGIVATWERQGTADIDLFVISAVHDVSRRRATMTIGVINPSGIPLSEPASFRAAREPEVRMPGHLGASHLNVEFANGDAEEGGRTWPAAVANGEPPSVLIELNIHPGVQGFSFPFKATFGSEVIGAERWHVPLEGNRFWRAVVGADGATYIGLGTEPNIAPGRLVRINEDGGVDWVVAFDDLWPRVGWDPAVNHENSLVGVMSHRVRCCAAVVRINRDGAVQFERDVDGNSGAAIHPSDFGVFATLDNRLEAFSLMDGSRLWLSPVLGGTGPYRHSPSVDREGNIWVFSSTDGFVNKVAPDGSLLWSVQSGATPFFDPPARLALDQADRAIVPGIGGWVRVGRDGNIHDKIHTPNPEAERGSHAVVDATGNIYGVVIRLATPGQTGVCSYQDDGILRWCWNGPAGSFSPTLDNHGRLWIGQQPIALDVNTGAVVAQIPRPRPSVFGLNGTPRVFRGQLSAFSGEGVSGFYVGADLAAGGWPTMGGTAANSGRRE